MRVLAVTSSACYRTAVGEDPRQARADRLARLQGLYAIVGDVDPVGRAEAVLAGGAGVIQLRMKRAPAGEILAAARQIVALARGRALVLVNDRPDLAILAGADGVHLGEEDLPVVEARTLVGEGLLVGRTARTAEAALAALAAGADHVGYGPVFASVTKPLDVPPRGLEALQATCAVVPAPVVAISGITLENIEAVAAAGAAAAAVIGDLFDRGPPAAAGSTSPAQETRARAEALAAAFARGAAGRRA